MIDTTWPCPARTVHEDVQLSLAPDERREPALHGHIQASAAATGAHDLEAPDRCMPFGGQLSEGQSLEEAGNRTVQGLADEYAAGPCRLL
jgi:hypothetical protein